VAESAEITELRTKLSEAKAALHKLLLGDKETQVGFGTNRMTQWQQAKPAELRVYIAELEGQLNALLGQVSTGRRGPIYPMGFPR
jgi:hypothetical protein